MLEKAGEGGERSGGGGGGLGGWSWWHGGSVVCPVRAAVYIDRILLDSLQALAASCLV